MSPALSFFLYDSSRVLNESSSPTFLLADSAMRMPTSSKDSLIAAIQYARPPDFILSWKDAS